MKRGAEAKLPGVPDLMTSIFEDEEDLEDAPEDEIEAIEEMVIDQATAAQTIAELEIEIETLRFLEKKARDLLRSGTNTKWDQLNSILDDPLMIDESGHHRKLIVFTEPKDTLNYLADKIRTRLGKEEAVVSRRLACPFGARAAPQGLTKRRHRIALQEFQIAGVAQDRGKNVEVGTARAR